MQIYRSKTLLQENANFAKFAELFGEAVVEGSAEPFLLVRDDDVRLLVVANDGSVMICIARGANDCSVSYGSSYTDGSRRFRGLSRDYMAKDENFVDPRFAIQAVHAFFDRTRISEHVDLRRGIPDTEITTFPTPIVTPDRVERQFVELHVVVPEELRTDMQSVCDYLDDVADDPDENIDFDDAIQIGSLCGGRIDRRKDIYLFSYYPSNGDVWDFRVRRTILDGVADGSISKLTVTASIPKSLENNAANPSGGPK
jgi:hypothetical protein